MAQALVVEGLTVAFGGVKALDDVSFRADVDIFGVIGPNGAGKSTLLNCLTGFQSYDNGRVRLGDASLAGAAGWNLPRHGMARSFQHPRLLDVCTVRENLYFGRGQKELRARWESDAFRQLRALLDPWLDMDVWQLPYGVKKIVDVARAALKATSLLLCDEPLSGLDQDSRDEMVSLLLSIVGSGVRLILIEHDVSRLFDICQQIVALDLGRKIAEGPPAQIAADPLVVERFLGVI